MSKKKKGWSPHVGKSMWDWIKTSEGRIDPKTGRFAGEYAAPPPPPLERLTYEGPSSQMPSRAMIPSRAPARDTYFEENFPAPKKSIFSWMSPSSDRINPDTGRPARFIKARPSPRDEDEFDPSQVASIDGWNMSGNGRGISAGWAVGLSILVGAGVMIALEATGVTNITGSKTQA